MPQSITKHDGPIDLFGRLKVLAAEVSSSASSQDWQPSAASSFGCTQRHHDRGRRQDRTKRDENIMARDGRIRAATGRASSATPVTASGTQARHPNAAKGGRITGP